MRGNIAQVLDDDGNFDIKLVKQRRLGHLLKTVTRTARKMKTQPGQPPTLAQDYRIQLDSPVQAASILARLKGLNGRTPDFQSDPANAQEAQPDPPPVDYFTNTDDARSNPLSVDYSTSAQHDLAVAAAPIRQLIGSASPCSCRLIGRSPKSNGQFSLAYRNRTISVALRIDHIARPQVRTWARGSFG